MHLFLSCAFALPLPSSIFLPSVHIFTHFLIIFCVLLFTFFSSNSIFSHLSKELCFVTTYSNTDSLWKKLHDFKCFALFCFTFLKV